MKVVGRDAWLKRMDPLPLVTLLRAPASTGKRTVAQAAAQAAGVSSVDQRLFPALEPRDEYGRPISPGDERTEVASWFEPELSVAHARELLAWSRLAPLGSPFKVAMVRLDHVRVDGTSWRASSRALNTMLKLLEEPPASARFVLLATRPTLPVVRSRAVELTAGLLTREQVAEVVYAVSDLLEADAKRVASLGGGRVAPSLAAQSMSEHSTQMVVDVLAALKARDRIALTEKSRIWTDVETELLIRWAHECLSERWEIFSGSTAPQMSPSAAERILRTVSAVRRARPRIVLGAVAALAT